MLFWIPVIVLFLLLWKGISMRHEKDKHCEVCNRRTRHVVTEYPDERIERCTQCKTRTITTYEEGNKPVGKEVKKVNRTPPEKKLGRPKKGEAPE